MKLAIVGTSKLTENEEKDARKLISFILKDYKPKLVITGGADGIDTHAKEVAEGLKISVKLYSPKSKNWDGYKARNIIIASECTHLVCITTKKIKTEGCYHHPSLEMHQRTGGCWTLARAKMNGKKTKLFVME